MARCASPSAQIGLVDFHWRCYLPDVSQDLRVAAQAMHKLSIADSESTFTRGAEPRLGSRLLLGALMIGEQGLKSKCCRTLSRHPSQRLHIYMPDLQAIFEKEAVGRRKYVPIGRIRVPESALFLSLANCLEHKV